MKRAVAPILAMLFLASLTGTAPPVPPATGETTASPRELVRSAGEAFAAERYDDALDLYGRAREVLPATPEIPYNMGVAAYRAGDLDRAAELFQQALELAESPSLRSRSAYNLGNTAYRRALEPPADPTAAPGADPSPQLNEAVESLDRAIEHYRGALDVDPTDADARANAELADRLKRELQKLAEKMPPQSSPSEQESSPENQQEQQQQQDQPQEQPQEQDENTAQQERARQQQQSGEQGDSSDRQEADARSTPEDDPPDEPERSPGEPQNEQPPEPESESESEPQPESTAEPGEEQPRDDERDGQRLSREEAERLLQSVRDKERQRREMLAKREAAGRPRVDKDW